MSIPEPVPSTEDALRETEGGSERWSLEPGELRCGSTVDRYVVLDRLGRGSMGIVYAAYDPQLDRQIALKILHAARGDASSVRRSQRMQREAQAMARLSHPNVIGVYDVGTFEGRVFISMEIVRGRTLTGWLREADRPWQQIVQTFVAAGRGLHAAHEAGLVHRDFKPDNVLVGEDGCVQVTDFGIARPARTGMSQASLRRDEAVIASSISGSGSRVIDMTLTRPGAMPGTPAYMSPEQFQGRPVDARGDQFSFCVALWGALYGHAPFAGRTPAQRAAAVSAGRLREPPSGTGTPAFVHRVLVRGLDKDPAERYPDMETLLDALARDPAQRRRRGLLVTGIVGLLALGVGALLARPGPCEGVDEPMAQTWNDTAMASVESAIVGTALPYADDTWQRVRPRLDGYADAWRQARVQACRATRVERVQTEAQRERRVECLERRRARLDALRQVLASGDPKVVRGATGAVMGLPRIDQCDDPDVLVEQEVIDDPRLAELRTRLDHLVTLEIAGRYDEAYARVPALVRELEPLGGTTELWVSALALEGTLAVRTDHQVAEAKLRKAYFAAVRNHSDLVAARLASSLVFVVGYQHARFDDAMEWSAHASAAIERAGAAVNDQAMLAKSEGDVLMRAGKLGQARERLEHALALLETIDDDSEARAQDQLHVRSSLAAVAIEQHDGERAKHHLTQALAVGERALGPRHPELARTHNELGNVAYQLGKDFEEARREYEIALELWSSENEPKAEVVTALSNLGNVYDSQGKAEDARARYEQALALGERVLGPDHPQNSLVLVNLGFFLENQQEDAEARRAHARALRIREVALGPEHPALANPLLGVARTALNLGEVEVAAEHALRALAIRRDAGEAGFGLAQALVSVGMVAARQERPVEAREHLERVLEICGTHRCDAGIQGLACLELAALDDVGSVARAEHLRRAGEFLDKAGTAGERFEARLAELSNADGSEDAAGEPP